MLAEELELRLKEQSKDSNTAIFPKVRPTSEKSTETHILDFWRKSGCNDS